MKIVYKFYRHGQTKFVVYFTYGHVKVSEFKKELIEYLELGGRKSQSKILSDTKEDMGMIFHVYSQHGKVPITVCVNESGYWRKVRLVPNITLSDLTVHFKKEFEVLNGKREVFADKDCIHCCGRGYTNRPNVSICSCILSQITNLDTPSSIFVTVIDR